MFVYMCICVFHSQVGFFFSVWRWRDISVFNSPVLSKCSQGRVIGQKEVDFEVDSERLADFFNGLAAMQETGEGQLLGEVWLILDYSHVAVPSLLTLLVDYVTCGWWRGRHQAIELRVWQATKGWSPPPISSGWPGGHPHLYLTFPEPYMGTTTPGQSINHLSIGWGLEPGTVRNRSGCWVQPVSHRAGYPLPSTISPPW